MRITSIELRQLRELRVGKQIELEDIVLRCEECTPVIKVKAFDQPCVNCFFFTPDEWGKDARGKCMNCPCISSCISVKRPDRRTVKFKAVNKS